MAEFMSLKSTEEMILALLSAALTLPEPVGKIKILIPPWLVTAGTVAVSAVSVSVGAGGAGGAGGARSGAVAKREGAAARRGGGG